MWKDIDIGINKKTDGDINDMVNVYAIMNSLDNIIKTMPGSRRMIPEFASSLYTMLFEPIDNTTSEKIGYQILGSIERWEDRIVIDNLNIEPKEDDNMYIITLIFHIINEGFEKHKYETILKAI